MEIYKLMESFKGQEVAIIKDGPWQEFVQAVFKGLNDDDYPLRKGMGIIPGEAFSGRFKCYNLALHDMVVVTESRVVVELGVRAGVSTDAFVRGAMSVGGHVYSYDPQDCVQRQYFAEGYDSNWTFYKQYGEDGYKDWPKDKLIDLFFVDTDPHNHDQTLMWLNEYWINSVKPGGYIILDDCEPAHQHGVRGTSYDFGTLQAMIEWVGANTDRVEFAILICQEVNGFGIIKTRS